MVSPMVIDRTDGTADDTRAVRIEAALRATWPDARVAVRDDSAQHAGHAGAAAGGQTHYAVAVECAVFAGLSRVERSRRVHALLDAEFAGGLHALALTLRAPGE